MRLEEGKNINWLTAEALAFGSLALEKIHVHVSGQDLEHGTFLQHHAVIHDQETEQQYIPLIKLPLPLSGYVKDTYEYILVKYDALNPVHKYTLLMGIILVNCLPRIFFPTDTVEMIKRASANQSPDALVDCCWTSLPRMEKENIKGVMDGRKHLVMFMVFIIALYDESSPLWQHMVASNTLGNPCTDKHSESLSAYIPSSALNSSI